MILSEFVNDFFNDKERNSVERMKSVSDEYNRLDDVIENPYNPENSKILEFTIKGNKNNIDAKISGILDYYNTQFVIKKLEVSDGIDDVSSVVRRLINSLVVNLESQYPEISIVYWRINKNNIDCIKACLDYGFTIEDSNSFSMELSYYVASSPIRQDFNTAKFLNYYKNCRYYD